MKKNNTSHKVRRPTAKRARSAEPLTIGLDLGDKTSRYAILDEHGEVLMERTVATMQKALGGLFGSLGPARVAMEVGTHSPWVSRLAAGCGHEVIVANSRNLRLISESSRKDDRMDARTLARLARADPQLLSPIRHRSAQAQAHLMVIRARAAVVDARTALINAARGLVKAAGERLPASGADAVNENLAKELSPALQPAIVGLLRQAAQLTREIHAYDRQILELAARHYAEETRRLQQIKGVGPLIAITYVLTLEDPNRFRRSRDVGCLLGLRPRRRDSGDRQPQLRITKEGDVYLRKLLVQGAHYILGPHGPDCDLRRWGEKRAARGGKNARKCAVVAVARKLAVLLHRLWVSGERYQPLRQAETAAAARASASAA